MTRVLSEVQANHCPAKLFERRNVSANLAILRFRVAERPSFIAGQYATIGIAVDGDVVERPYSIVSSPHEPFLEFFIELVPGGNITPKLWELKLGSTLLVRRRIVGQFYFGHGGHTPLDARHSHRRGAVCQYPEN